MDRLTLFIRYLTFPITVGLCLAIFAVVPSVALAGDVAVIVHAGVPADDLSLTQIRRILLGDRQFWSSELRVTLLIPASVTPERDVLLKIAYQMSEAQFRRYWIAKVFRAEATVGPKIVYSNKMATELVGAIPGSIVFMDAEQIPKELKVLKINGYLPGEKRYPLR